MAKKYDGRLWRCDASQACNHWILTHIYALDLCGAAAVTFHVNAVSAPNYRERDAFPWRWRIHAVKVKLIRLACVNTASLTDFLVYVIRHSTDLNDQDHDHLMAMVKIKCNKWLVSEQFEFASAFWTLNRILPWYSQQHHHASIYLLPSLHAWVISSCFEIKIFKSKTKR